MAERTADVQAHWTRPGVLARRTFVSMVIAGARQVRLCSALRRSISFSASMSFGLLRLKAKLGERTSWRIPAPIFTPTFLRYALQGTSKPRHVQGFLLVVTALRG